MNPNALALRFLIAYSHNDDEAMAAAHADTTNYPEVVEALCRIAHLAGPQLRTDIGLHAMRHLILGFAQEVDQ